MSENLTPDSISGVDSLAQIRPFNEKPPLLMGILNMQIQQSFVPPGDETAINWAPEHCAARSR